MGDRPEPTEYDTPKRAKVRGAIEYMEARGIPHFKEDAMISEGSVDRRYHNTDEPERRGRPSLVSNWRLKEMDRLIREEELGFEVGLEGVNARTIARAMGNRMNYSKCIACQKRWVNESTARARKDWAEYSVRFSDEVHWAIGPQGSIYIIRRPGQHYCADCIQRRDEKDDHEREMKRLHAWAAFYEIASNTNGKMTQRLERGDCFVLEEDGDSGHRPSKKNVVREWKQTYKLKHYFNCHLSPDFAIIKNC
ncbi:hypothetical protein K469DRAFT_734281 [Zopfia rhizophila CBS 207.26]|uniref:Uncharacterized protein n=1 Tax=Zopfia rhizophila CBS 207.26 TaxID=1314779 RepID=A0A6A6EUT1_9PEZI|nr:hypothetical protein K469DRAFT_734281 [Zopfia rhizophila CBS 207.26]